MVKIHDKSNINYRPTKPNGRPSKRYITFVANARNVQHLAGRMLGFTLRQDKTLNNPAWFTPHYTRRYIRMRNIDLWYALKGFKRLIRM